MNENSIFCTRSTDGVHLLVKTSPSLLPSLSLPEPEIAVFIFGCCKFCIGGSIATFIWEGTFFNETTSSDSSDENLAATSGTMRYRTQNRGGKGLRDIKTTQRNVQVVDIASVHDDDEILMISAKGMIHRMQVSDVRIIGRNTQGVLIMRLKKEDSLVALVKVPKEDLITSSSEDRQT